MQNVTIKDLAIMLEKPMNAILEEAKDAKALILEPGSSKICVDLEVYQKYMDGLIIELGQLQTMDSAKTGGQETCYKDALIH